MQRLVCFAKAPRVAITVLCWAGLLALLCGGTLLGQSPAPKGGRDYLVDSENPNSSDANPGTAARPFKSIRKAAEVAEAGDVVLVQPGTYRNDVEVRHSGIREKPIVFYSVKRHGAVVPAYCGEANFG
jgi:hypothetical protein